MNASAQAVGTLRTDQANGAGGSQILPDLTSPSRSNYPQACGCVSSDCCGVCVSVINVPPCTADVTNIDAM